MRHSISGVKGEGGLRARLSRTVAFGALVAMATSFAPLAIAQDAEAEDESTRRLGTIEVTATRRDGVTVQDVPIAVTAYDAELLEQVNFQRANDLNQLSPSVVVGQGQSASAGTNISIRGIGTGADNFGFEPAVGIFVDGVYRTRTGSGVQELPELAGVEVLRGPQGTLFGRNTSAGVVSIRTAKPTFEPSAHAGVTIGNFNNLEFEGGVSGEVAENFAARFDFRWRERDGFIDDINNPDADINDIDRFLVRGQLLYEKGNTDLRLIADYSETNENCCAATIRQTGLLAAVDLGLPTGPLNGFNAIAGANGSIGILEGTDPGDDGFRTGAFSPNRSFSDEVQDWGVSAEINHDFGNVKVTSITSLRNFDSTRSQDIDFSGIDAAARDGTTNADLVFTQELRAQGTAFDGRLDWLVGGFYLNEQIETFDTIQLGADFAPAADLVLTGNAGTPAQFFGTLGPQVPAFLFTDNAGLVTGGALPGATVPFAVIAGSPLFPVIINDATNLAIASLIGSGADPTAPGFADLVAGSVGGFVVDAAGGLGLTPIIFPAPEVNSGAFDTFDQTTNAIAIFTHNEFQVTDKLTLTGGLRYNYEDKGIRATLTGDVASCQARLDAGNDAIQLLTAIGQTAAIGPTIGALALACNSAVDTTLNGLSGGTESRTESEFTGSVKASYSVTPDFLVYSSYSRGFKSGGFDLNRGSFDSLFAIGDGPQLTDLEFEEETVNAYEVGIKTSWLDGRYTVNATGFFQDVQDFQQNVFNGTNFIVSSSDVESFGIELDLLAQPIDGLVVQSGFLWADVTRAEDLTVGGFAPADRQIGARFTATGSATYTFPLVGDIEGYAHANARWQSNVNLATFGALDPANAFNAVTGDSLDALNNGDVTIANARVGVQTSDGKYNLSVFAENVFQTDFNAGAFEVPTLTGTFASFPNDPRVWGVELRARF